MICEHCGCATPDDRPHLGPAICLLSLLDWRKEAEARLIRYEEESARRETAIKNRDAIIEAVAASINECQHDGGCRAFKHLK
jgi:hypothetical protein